MNHDDDVSPRGKSEAIASLLICAVTAIYRVHLHLDVVKCACDCHGLVLAGVVHHNHKIDNALRHHLIVSLA